MTRADPNVKEGPRPGIAVQCVVIGGAVLGTLTSVAIAPALPQIAESVGGQIGGELTSQLIMTMPGISLAVCAPLVGLIASRMGLRQTLIASLVLYLLAGLAGAVLDNSILLAASRILVGAASAGVTTLAATIAGTLAPARRNHLLGLASAAAGAVSIVGFAGAGVLVDSFGWRASFLLYAAALPVLVAAILGVSRSYQEQPRDKVIFPLGAFRSLWFVYVAVFFVAIGIYAPTIQGPFMLGSQGVTRATHQGLLLSIMALTSTVTSASYGWIAARIREDMLPGVMLAFTGIGLVVMGTWSSATGFGLGIALAGIGAGLAFPVLLSLFISRTTEYVRPHAIGLCYTLFYLAMFVAPMVLKPLAELFGGSGALVSIGLLLVLIVMGPSLRQPNKCQY